MTSRSVAAVRGSGRRGTRIAVSRNLDRKNDGMNLQKPGMDATMTKDGATISSWGIV